MRGFWSALSGIFSRVLGNRRGSPTIEYVIVMSAAALLGLAIFNAVISEPVKKSMACAIKTQIARINQDASVLAGCEAFVGGGSSSHNRILQGASQFDQKSPYSSLSYEGSNHSPPNLGPLGDGNQQKPHIQPLKNKQDTGLWGSFKNGLGWLWDKTKEYSGKAWDFTKGVASDVWDWIKDHTEELGAIGTVVLGVVLCFVPFAEEAGVALIVRGAGYSILGGSGIGGLFSYLQGNGPKEIARDIMIGGIVGLITHGVGEGIGQTLTSVLGKVAKPIVQRLAPYVSNFMKFIGAGGTASASDDILHGRKIDWKKAGISALATLLLFSGGHYINKYGTQLIQGINNLKNPFAQEVVLANGSTYQPKIGDTAFGQWLQKFAGQTASSEGVQAAKWLSESERESIRAANLRKYGQEPSSKKEFSPNENAGKVVDKNGKKYLTYYDGRERAIRNSSYAGKNFTIDVNGQKYEVPFDQNGFPDFRQWTDYESRLNVDQYLLVDDTQFKLLDKRLAKDMENNPELTKKIDNTFLEVLEKGIGDRNSPGIEKLKVFIRDNPVIKNNLSDSELSELSSGRGSATLIEKLNKNPKLKEEFIKANHEWISKGEDPVGYVWHHHQEEGLMQLVKSRVHGNIRHTGGRQIWGGGR